MIPFPPAIAHKLGGLHVLIMPCVVIPIISRSGTLRRGSVFMEAKARTARMAESEDAALDPRLPCPRASCIQVLLDNEIWVEGQPDVALQALAIGTSKQMFRELCGSDRSNARRYGPGLSGVLGDELGTRGSWSKRPLGLRYVDHRWSQ